MTVDELEARLANLQNFLIDNYTITEEIWAYHPANPDFINPIKMYDDLIIEAHKLEEQIDEIQSKLLILKSVN
jgi:hypothetical protein